MLQRDRDIGDTDPFYCFPLLMRLAENEKSEREGFAEFAGLTK